MGVFFGLKACPRQGQTKAGQRRARAQRRRVESSALGPFREGESRDWRGEAVSTSHSEPGTQSAPNPNKLHPPFPLIYLGGGPPSALALPRVSSRSLRFRRRCDREALPSPAIFLFCSFPFNSLVTSKMPPPPPLPSLTASSSAFGRSSNF